jgi:dsRNA-specific ribonuclease
MSQSANKNLALHEVLINNYNPMSFLQSHFVKDNEGMIEIQVHSLSIPSSTFNFGFVYPTILLSSFDFFVYRNSSSERENCRIDFIRTQKVDEAEMQEFYLFHKFFFADLKLISICMLDEVVIDFKEMFSPNSKTPIALFLPLNAYNQIKRRRIKKFLEIRYLRHTTEIDDVVPKSIVQSKFNSRTLYIVFCKIINPLKTPAEYLIRSICEEYGWDIDDLLREYRIGDGDELSSMSVNDFLVNYDFEPEIIKKLSLSHINKGSTTLTNENPLLLMKTILGVGSFKLHNKFKKGQQSCANRKQRPFPRLAFANDVDLYPFRITEVDDAMRVPSAFMCFSKFYSAKILKNFYRLPAKDSTLIKALCTKQFDSEHNLETLESLGDCVLKLITVTHLFVDFPSLNENQLSQMKSRLISNLHYSQVADKLGLPHFLLSTPQVKTNFPLFVEIRETIFESKLTRKNLSDAFEAIISAMFVDNHTLLPVFSFLFDQTSLFINRPSENVCKRCSFDESHYFRYHSGSCLRCFSFYPEGVQVIQATRNRRVRRSSKKYKNSNFVIRNEYLTGPISKKFIHQDCFDFSKWKLKLYRNVIESAHNHFSFIKNEWQYKHSMRINDVTKALLSKDALSHVRVINHCNFREISLIENIIGYRFRNKQLIIDVFWIDESRNFQRYEFFGDIIIELMVVSSLVNCFESRGTLVKPERIQKAKRYFLSNKAICKFMLLFGLSNLISTKDQAVLVGSKEPLLWLNENMLLGEFLEIDTKNYSKKISDVWEALAYAIFLDGGFPALEQSFLRLMTPFLIYYADNIM